MTSARLVKTLSVRNRLGEGVVWDGRTGTVYWTDIESKEFWFWRMNMDQPVSISLPYRLGSFALTPLEERFIGAFENGFAVFNLAGAIDMLVEIEPENSATRMNDGRVDRGGRFWAGTMTESEPAPDMPKGHLWRLDGRGCATSFLSGLSIPNSLCWNSDGSRMYFADSPSHQINTYQFDDGPTGEPVPFARTPDGIHPDGSTLDSEGCLWNAEWGASQLTRYKPDGQVDLRLQLPVSQPTCMAFGGPDLSHLFVTSAADGLDADAEGALLVYETDYTGLPEQLCTTPLGK